MDVRRNMLIGFVVAVVIVGALSYATGLTKLIRSSFGRTTEYKSSPSAAAPELAAAEWINSEPLKLSELRGRVVLIEFWTFGCMNSATRRPSLSPGTIVIKTKG